MKKLTFEEITAGKLEIHGRLIDASNATLFGEIEVAEGSGERSAYPVVYKPIAGERPLWDFPDGSLASREVAAFRLSKFAEFNLVPITVLRDGPFGVGAVQQWIDVPDEFDPIAFGQSDDPRLRSMAIFDYIVNNTDRKFGHILIDTEGDLFGCDHGVTFHVEYKLRTVLWQFAGEALSEAELSILTRLRDGLPSLIEELDELLSPAELNALAARIEGLLSEGSFPFPSPEWPAVPWPPV